MLWPGAMRVLYGFHSAGTTVLPAAQALASQPSALPRLSPRSLAASLTSWPPTPTRPVWSATTLPSSWPCWTNRAPAAQARAQAAPSELATAACQQARCFLDGALYLPSPCNLPLLLLPRCCWTLPSLVLLSFAIAPALSTSHYGRCRARHHVIQFPFIRRFSRLFSRCVAFPAAVCPVWS